MVWLRETNTKMAAVRESKALGSHVTAGGVLDRSSEHLELSRSFVCKFEHYLAMVKVLEPVQL